MTIAFYKVDNSLNYERHTFDTLRPETIIEKLQLLPDDEVKFYDSKEYSMSSRTPSLADFEQDYNDEELDEGWWCIIINDMPKEEKKKTLESMISAHAYNEIASKVESIVGDEAATYIFPAVKKALEEGSPDCREKILIDWLDCDSMRVCTYCGKIMEEGWYLNTNGYACSDECAAESEGITMEQFEKWRIYKDDIVAYLEDEALCLEDPEKCRKIEDLTKEECDEIISEIAEDLDYYYTEWY